jgi:hypothetical protein
VPGLLLFGDMANEDALLLRFHSSRDRFATTISPSERVGLMNVGRAVLDEVD